MPLFGTPVARTEDHHFLVGGARYISNLEIPGVAAVTYVISSAAHARISGINVERARKMPGVIDVVTAADVTIGPFPTVDPSWSERMPRSLLASDVVRFVGEPIVAIVADTAAAAADAADEVEVDYEPLAAVVDVEEARRGEVLLFPDLGTNVITHDEGGNGDPDVDSCEVVVRATFKSHRLAPCPLETRIAASRWEDDGRLTHWSSCQGAHPIRDVLAAVYGRPTQDVRVIAPDVGGSFGSKARPYPEELLLPWLAARVGRPVRWIPTRSQDMVGLGHSRVQVQHVAIGGRRDGTLEALDIRLVVDVGAYPLSAPFQGRNTGALSSGAYTIPRIRWVSEAVATTTTPLTAYRGAGRPESSAMLERAVDLFAAEIGMDPIDVRRRNFIKPHQFPYSAATGLVYDSGDYEQCLDRALEMVGIDDVRAEQAHRRASGDRVQVGIGVATFVDRTAGVPSTEYGATELRPDGTVLVHTGSSPYGQGHHTSWAMLVADRTGLPLDRIEVVHGDTDVVPRGSNTGGSRSVQRAGSAIAEAADGLVDLARAVAADVLEAALDDVVLDVDRGGLFHVVGTASRTVGWSDVAAHAAANGRDGSGGAPTPDRALKCEADAGGTPSFPFGAYVAVVEVDTETGKVRLRRLITVDDAGMILNPLLAHGQVHGGAAQGVAEALLEEFVYDSDGNPLTSTFADYAVISAAELPMFEGALVETPSPANILGAKGIAESGTIGAPPAVQSAVVDALRPFGVRDLDLPATPERVWQAIVAARA
ncbi:MAG: cutL [Acidimicrobiales bacterium]|nr:cutL [Acidimicrobiales bacterium]